MTDRLQALIALRDAVKDGCATALHFRSVWPGYGQHDSALAFNGARAVIDGSVIAAVEFHKTALQGWKWHVGMDSATVWRDTPDAQMVGLQHEHCEGDPAVALFLTDLAALIAIEEDK